MLTMANIDEALKLFYLDAFRYQLNDKASILLAQIEKTSENVVGKKIVMALRYGRVGGIGNRSDDGTLPTPNARKTKQAEWDTKNIFARFQITEKAIAASRSREGAFAPLLQQEFEDCEKDTRLDLSRQVLGDGTGVLATASAAAHNNGVVTVTVDSTMYLAEGMLVDIRKSDGNQRHADCDEVEITAVLSDTQFTYAGTTNTPADTDIVVVAGNFGKELTGLDAVIASGTTLYGIDRSTPGNQWLDGRLKNIGGELRETDIQYAIDEVERTSGSEINFLLCSYGVRRAYQSLQTAMKQFANKMTLTGGWEALSYTGGKQTMALAADKYVKPGRMYCLDLSDWKMYQMADWDWMDRDGAILTRVVNKPAWEATLLKFCDLGCQRPKGQFLLYGIAEH